MSVLSSRHADDKSAWTLPQWLEYLESIHTSSIDMGLDRIKAVASDLLSNWSETTVVTVAGTNGKGTTCAMIEQGCLASGKTVAVYSSPHLFDYRERLRINGEMLDPQLHCEAFLKVEKARGDTSLTYFEFSTLAAFALIGDVRPDIALLEIGLGGRLDAVNIIDPDIAVITSIDLDHQDWLGDTRELIGAEKAGIMRAGIPVVVGDPEPPESVLIPAKANGSLALFNGDDFGYSESQSGWSWFGGGQCFPSLNTPHIPVQNASTALQVMQLLGLCLDTDTVNDVIGRTRLPGRFQKIARGPDVYVDVAHNPQATRYLKSQIASLTPTKVHLVVGMLADKDIDATLAELMSLNSDWYPATLPVPRGEKSERIKQVLVGCQTVLPSDSVQEAYRNAQSRAAEGDLIVVFGSFFTAAEILTGI